MKGDAMIPEKAIRHGLTEARCREKPVKTRRKDEKTRIHDLDLRLSLRILAGLFLLPHCTKAS
jgi:hypothetical protein